MYLGSADGKVTARVPNPVVDSDLLQKVYAWITAGATIDDVIDRLRIETVPLAVNSTPSHAIFRKS